MLSLIIQNPRSSHVTTSLRLLLYIMEFILYLYRDEDLKGDTGEEEEGSLEVEQKR